MSAKSTEISTSAPPGRLEIPRMHQLHSRLLSDEGPYAIARIRTPPGPRNGALQSLQRGGDGNAPQICRILWSRGTLPVSMRSHISSTVGLAIAPTLAAA